MPSPVSQAELTSPLVQAGIAYWTSRKGVHRSPARSDFDPLIDIPALVPSIMLKDVKYDPLDFRYRLIGSAIRDHLERDLTGRWMSAISGQGPGNPLWAAHERAVTTRAPVFLRPAYVGPHKEFLHIESAILPLASDHEHIDMLMIFAGFVGRQMVKRNASTRTAGTTVPPLCT